MRLRELFRREPTREFSGDQHDEMSRPGPDPATAPVHELREAGRNEDEHGEDHEPRRPAPELTAPPPSQCAEFDLGQRVGWARGARRDDDALRAEWAERGPDAQRALAELDRQVDLDEEIEEKQRELHQEQEAVERDLRERVGWQRGDRGDDAALRREMSHRVRETGSIRREQELMTGGGEGWWTEDADNAALELRELDRQLRAELGDDEFETLCRARDPEREEIDRDDDEFGDLPF